MTVGFFLMDCGPAVVAVIVVAIAAAVAVAGATAVLGAVEVVEFLTAASLKSDRKMLCRKGTAK